MNEREKNGNYQSFENFVSRCESKVLNKRLVENLIYAGAFDCFGKNRSQLIAIYDELIDRVMIIAKQRESDQMSLFGDFLREDENFTVTYPNIPEYDTKTKLSLEKNVTGVYVSGHPLDGFKSRFADCTFTTEMLANVEEDEDGNKIYTDVKNDMPVYLGGIITASDKITTRSGSNMAFVTLEDTYGAVECVFFPKTYEKYKDCLTVEQVVKIHGKLQIKDDKASVIVDNCKSVGDEETREEAPKEKPKKDYLGIILRDDTKSFKNELIDILSTYPGDIIVCFKIDGKNYKMSQTVRNCKGLYNELLSIVDAEDIKFFSV